MTPWIGLAVLLRRRVVYSLRTLASLLEARHELAQRQFELRDLVLVLVDMSSNLLRAFDGLLEILLLPLAKLSGMLNRLLEARDFPAHLQDRPTRRYVR